MNLSIDTYISELLFRHDCVIVPGLGGFVSNAVPARINAVQHVLYPPSKVITFNKNIQHNDGLLANYIAEKAKIEYVKSLKAISDFADECRKKLREGQPVLLAGLGRLYADASQHIQFDADRSANYLLTSYGLPNIQVRPVKRTTIEQQIEKKFKDRPPVQAPRIYVSRKTLVAAAAVLLVAFLFTWTAIRTDMLRGNRISYSDLNPFKDLLSSETTTDITPPNLRPADAVPSAPAPPAAVLPGTPAESEVMPATPVNTSTTLPDSVRNALELNASALPEPANKFFIVGGCFSVYENAAKLVETLHAKGVGSAAIIGKNAGGLHIVSIEGFASYNAASAALSRIHTEVEASAWIYRQD